MYKRQILICGEPNKTLPAKRELGYIPELPAVYELLTVEEHLEFIRRAYRVEDDGYGDSLLERLELDDKRKKLGRELSKGMQQKLSICCALVHRPRVLIFDEPLVGLDPHAIKELKMLFRELRAEGRAVPVSYTHLGLRRLHAARSGEPLRAALRTCLLYTSSGTCASR